MPFLHNFTIQIVVNFGPSPLQVHEKERKVHEMQRALDEMSNSECVAILEKHGWDLGKVGPGHVQVITSRPPTLTASLYY